MLVVLSGPSGVGKDTLIARLRAVEPGIQYSVSCTTRAPRPGEIDGVHYTFLTRPQFDQLIAGDGLLEWAEVHGHRYGTPRSRLEEARERDVILKIDVQGAAKLRAAGVPALYIFLAPPSLEELLRRLVGRRTEDPQSLARREADARSELAEASRYDHVVVNDDVDRAAREVAGLIHAATARA
jgi:guanylate kinase